MTPTVPPAPASKSSNNTVLIIVLVLVGFFMFCACLGVVAAIAIPNYLKFTNRARMAECKMNLKAVYTAQKAHFAEHDDFGDTAEIIGFKISSASTRYTYFGGPELIVMPTAAGALPVDEDQLPGLLGGELPGVNGECPDDCTFVGACVGNIDSDAALDVWSISTKPREHNGKPIQAGEPFHDVDDLTE